MTLITAETVADMIGMSKASFLHRREDLELDRGFPCPLPTCLRPLKWRQDAVQHWLDAQGLSRTAILTEASIRAAGPNVVLMKEARQA
ncbi:MAG: hypothetical protein CML69_00910 [Rhodobacteraceae bacterium]|nr:hypothetical protein [Paracoccaceae bacterium]